MNWLSARAVARGGQGVTRASWMDRYIYFSDFLYWIQFFDPVTKLPGALRVVKSGDFGLTEFQALDWIAYGQVNQQAAVDSSTPFTAPAIRIQIVFTDPVDDDVRLTVGGIVVEDQQRNVGWYGGTGWLTTPYPTLDYTVGKNGDWVQIDCFDGWGWGTSYRTSPWAAYVYVGGVLSQTVVNSTPVFSGGSRPAPVPLPSDMTAYYAAGPWFFDYHSMGGFTITV